ncbi:AI-2E family transporter [Methanobrevibacter sp. OttesenSCG-928-K11]|nr:AI-2E family transporter [Methanobrevibacter sp. OttesenSCG-928-K11]
MKKNIIDLFSTPGFVIIILLIISLATITPVVNMLILGAILAYGIRPISNKLQSKVKNSSISVFIALLIIIVPLVLLIIYIVITVAGISMDFINSTSLSAQMDTQYITSEISKYLPINQTGFVSNVTSSVYGFVSELLTWIANYAIKLAQEIPYIFLQLFILFASIFYFARDGDRCFNFIKSIIPENNMSFFNTLVVEIDNVLKSVFYGHFVTSLIIGIIAGVGYFLLGYPYGLFLGIITGIFQLIPIMGPWPIYWALAIIDVINGNYIRPIFVILFGFGLSLSDMYIRPALSSHHADIHPLILLIGFLAGPFVFGAIGLILGPLILGITFAVIKSYQIEKNKESEKGV